MGWIQINLLNSKKKKLFFFFVFFALFFSYAILKINEINLRKKEVSFYLELNHKNYQNHQEIKIAHQELSKESLFSSHLSDEKMVLSLEDKKLFKGLLHAHSTSSDGADDVEDVFKTAKMTKYIDFYGITDHDFVWGISDFGEWERQKKVAQKYSDEHFLALRGYEYSNLFFGHYIVLNSDLYYSSFYDPLGVSGFYKWLKKTEQKDTLVIFAHPGFHFHRYFTDFHHFEFDQELVNHFIGVEVHHWREDQSLLNGFHRKKTFMDEAMEKGWYLGAVSSQDSHAPKDVKNDPMRLGVFMENLSENSLYDALRERRFFASPHPSIQISVEIKDVLDQWRPLGSKLKKNELHPDEQTIRVVYYEPEPERVPIYLEMILDGSLVKVWQKDFKEERRDKSNYFAGEFTISFPKKLIEDSERSFIYFRFYQMKNDHTVNFPTITSPIFID